MKKSIIFSLGALLIASCAGISALHEQELIPPGELQDKDSGRMAVLTSDGTTYQLEEAIVGTLSVDGWGVKYLSDSTSVNFSGSIPISEIVLVRTDRPQIGASLLLYGTIGVLATTMAGSSDDGTGVNVEIEYPSSGGGGWWSCPHVFSFDGEKYQFESETFAGAICRGFEHSNMEALKYLSEHDGVYRLALANQAPESEHVNELALFVADHPPGTKVVPDGEGNLHTVRVPRPSQTAATLAGKDMLASVAAVDGELWESDLSQKKLNMNEQLRDGLVCEFAKPHGVTTAKLIVTCSNTYLANFALERLFSLCGPSQLRWYYELNTNPAERYKLFSWIVREGGLEVSLWIDGRWERQGMLLEVGPRAVAEKIVPLDVTQVNGDIIRVKLESTVDLWRIDGLAMDFSPDEPIDISPAPLVTAITQAQTDVAGLIRSSDTLYYSTLPGDYALLTFGGVPPRPGLERSFVLKSQGYYYPWIREGTEDRRTLVEHILAEPGLGSRLYLSEWKGVRNRYRNAGAPQFSVSVIPAMMTK